MTLLDWLLAGKGERKRGFPRCLPLSKSHCVAFESPWESPRDENATPTDERFRACAALYAGRRGGGAERCWAGQRP